MDKQYFNGFSITPNSYQDSDMLGYWFPSATVDGETVTEALVRLPPQRGIDKVAANALAVVEAKRRITSGSL